MNKIDSEFYGTISEYGHKFIENAINKDFFIISASRGENSKEENQKRNNELLRDLRKKFNRKTIGAYSLIGHWKDYDLDTEDYIEFWFINVPDDLDFDELENAIQELAKLYEQDAYVRRNKTINLKSKNGDIWQTFKNPSNVDDFVKQGFEKILSLQGFTQFKHDRDHGKVRNIVFEWYNLKPKENIGSKRLFNEIGISYE